MRRLLTADWHLTDKPLDEYRWDFIPWLGKQLKDKKIDVLYILGDLTEKKDKHNAIFLNRILCSINFLKRN